MSGAWQPYSGRVGKFTNRNQGHGKAIKVWFCQACFAWHEGFSGIKPKDRRCWSCGRSGFLLCDSKGEARHFAWLVQRQKSGEISDLTHHPEFPIYMCDREGQNWEAVFSYYADASYVERGQFTVVDFKPGSVDAQDPVFKLKRRLVEKHYGIAITIVN